MNRIAFATNNAHKLEEVKALLACDFEIISLKALGCTDEIAETADSLEGNALIKARYIYQKYGCDCFADDTGLEVEALHGEPGVFSARYAGTANDAKANMHKLLANLQGITPRNAAFRTVIALILNGDEYLFEGKIEGQIALEPSGMGGFGYDPVFVPNGYTLSFANLGMDEKNKISHRALAVKKLVRFLNNKNNNLVD